MTEPFDFEKADREATQDAIARAMRERDAEQADQPSLAVPWIITIALSGLAIAVPIFLIVSKGRDHPVLFGALDLALASLPWVAVWLVHRQPLLYKPVPVKGDRRPSLLVVLFAAGTGLFFSPYENMNLDMGHVGPILLFACVPGLLLAAMLYGAAQQSLATVRTLLTLLFFCLLYGISVAVQVDTRFDPTPAQDYTASILGKTSASGSRGGRTYYLLLSPWNQQQSGQTRVHVASSLYDSVSSGDSVCITERDGALGTPWYSVHRCP